MSAKTDVVVRPVLPIKLSVMLAVLVADLQNIFSIKSMPSSVVMPSAPSSSCKLGVTVYALPSGVSAVVPEAVQLIKRPVAPVVYK